ncbi:hypothetical protein DAI22_03g209950 [Oryza sativa Japonica Group]|nr:hypothetical protein DAI22_03g209950 [Oryza sativa Japonica Group]
MPLRTPPTPPGSRRRRGDANAATAATLHPPPTSWTLHCPCSGLPLTLGWGTARLAAAACLGRDMPGLDDTTGVGERRGRWRGRVLAGAPCCHVEWRGSATCSEGSFEEELRRISRCQCVQRRLQRIVRRW